MHKIAVGVSGGIDSAATVMMLKNRGFDVYGIRFSVLADSNDFNNEELSNDLGIEIKTVDISENFKKTIISQFIDSYMLGSTPSPCVECNCGVKWRVIEDFACDIGAKHWATGHYAQITERDGLYYISKGVDPLKDQSYYLWKLSQATLKGAVMPLGGYLKSEIKYLMHREGFCKLSTKKESMGICFLGAGGYKELLKKSVPNIELLSEGEVVDKDGKILGYHDGYPFYTLAQRKGLPIARPNCVVDIDIERNRLIIGNENDLFSEKINVKDYKFVSLDEILTTKKLKVKVRGIGINPEGYCNIEIIDDNKLKIKLLNDKAWAVMRGQPVVFYIEDRVVGGGYAL